MICAVTSRPARASSLRGTPGTSSPINHRVASSNTLTMRGAGRAGNFRSSASHFPISIILLADSEARSQDLTPVAIWVWYAGNPPRSNKESGCDSVALAAAATPYPAIDAKKQAATVDARKMAFREPWKYVPPRPILVQFIRASSKSPAVSQSCPAPGRRASPRHRSPRTPRRYKRPANCRCARPWRARSGARRVPAAHS